MINLLHHISLLKDKKTFSPEADPGPFDAWFDLPDSEAVIISLLKTEWQNRKHVRLAICAGWHYKLRTRLATTMDTQRQG